MTLETFFQKFDLFADAPDAVTKMRELVLHLAVTGKLSVDSEAWTELPLGEVSRLRRGYDLPTQDRKSGSVPIFAANGPVGVHEIHKVKGPGVVTGRSGSIGKVHFVDEDFWPLNTALYVEDFFGNYPQFICMLLRSLHLERFSTATAVPTLNRNVVHKETVKVPPLAEQKRIVAKVDELMALCDRLEEQQQERETRHAALARASLARFADAPTPANLPFLFHPSYAIPPADLRKSILTLAVQGKLVPQDPNDEPAFKQLQRSAAKKSATGRVARVKVGSTGRVAPEETDTHVPDGWEKASLAGLVTVLNGRAYSKDELLTAGTPVLRVGNLFTSKHWYYSDLELEADKYCDMGDLIFAWSASFGPFIWAGPKVIYHYHIWKLELHSETDLDKSYLHWFLQNKTQEIKRAGHGVSMIHMTKEKMELLEVMLPPLAEQRRIVAKVEQLMTLVDALETQLAASRATAANLLSALVAEVTTR